MILTDQRQGELRPDKSFAFVSIRASLLMFRVQRLIQLPLTSISGCLRRMLQKCSSIIQCYLLNFDSLRIYIEVLNEQDSSKSKWHELQQLTQDNPIFRQPNKYPTMQSSKELPKLFKLLDQQSRRSKLTPILCTNFQKKPIDSSPGRQNLHARELKLFNECIISTKVGGSVSKSLELTFELSFQIIREPTTIEKEDKKVIGKAKGIRFRLEGHKFEEYYTERPSEVEKWEIELGKRINQRGFHQMFKAMKKVGKGNFASVYMGERLKDGKLFAIKSFAKEATYSQENGKAAIINEIKINRMFDHPNLMKMQGVYETDNSLYMILEYIEGPQLWTKLLTKHRFEQSETKKALRDLLQGLAEMARKNVIHRDLKPENILFRKDGKDAVIVDFGLATIADESNYLFVRCGTPGYVAPQIINLKDLTTKSHTISDVFSIGAIFYHMLFGKSLFPGKAFNEVLTQNRECDFVLAGREFDSVPDAGKNTPDSAGDLLRKMLQKQPQLRITAAQALRHQYFAKEAKVTPTFTPKIQYKESSSCPMYLLDKKNEAKIRFIVKQEKSLLSRITSLNRESIHLLKPSDIRVSS